MPRVYAVETDEELTLVTANTQAQALNHVVKTTYKVRPASALDVVDYMQAGGKVEDATNAAETPETQEGPEPEVS